MSKRAIKQIGSGRKRIVYDLGNGYVLKVAKSKAGRDSNKTEYRLYHSSRIGSLRKHLAKVIKYKSRWIMMKKYTRPFRDSKKNRMQYLRLKRRFRQKGIIPRDMYSMTRKGPSLTNLRLDRKGKIIVIDYGNFKIQSRESPSRKIRKTSEFRRAFQRKRFLGMGARRIVFDLRNGLVLKQAKSKFGVKSNRKEAMFYRTTPLTLKKHLGKILSCHPGYRWVIMKKYTQEVPKTYAYQERVVKLKHKFRIYGIMPYEVTRRLTGKPNYPNLRLNSNGRIIVIDYGNFERR